MDRRHTGGSHHRDIGHRLRAQPSASFRFVPHRHGNDTANLSAHGHSDCATAAGHAYQRRHRNRRALAQSSSHRFAHGGPDSHAYSDRYAYCHGIADADRVVTPGAETMSQAGDRLATERPAHLSGVVR